MLQLVGSLSDWLLIDAVLDNAHQAAIGDYNDNLAAKTLRLREAIWDATGHVTRPLATSGHWPPDAATLAETLPLQLDSTDWRFAIERLSEAASVARTLEQPGASDLEDLERRLRTEIRY